MSFFGYTFPSEGNRNRLMWRYSYCIPPFGDTFPSEGNRNSTGIGPICLIRVWKLWRHFPVQRESKPHAVSTVSRVNQRSLETLSRWKGREGKLHRRSSLSLLTQKPFGDTFPIEGNRNIVKIWCLQIFPGSFGDTFPVQGNRNKVRKEYRVASTLLSLETLSRAKGIETSQRLGFHVRHLLHILWRHFPGRREGKPKDSWLAPL